MKNKTFSSLLLILGIFQWACISTPTENFECFFYKSDIVYTKSTNYRSFTGILLNKEIYKNYPYDTLYSFEIVNIPKRGYNINYSIPDSLTINLDGNKINLTKVKISNNMIFEINKMQIMQICKSNFLKCENIVRVVYYLNKEYSIDTISIVSSEHNSSFNNFLKEYVLKINK